jgi:ketosteroid isomerase-like protein
MIAHRNRGYCSGVAEENVEIVRQGYLDLAEHGYEAMLTLVHPDFEMVTPASLASEPDVYRGPEGARRWWKGFDDAMEGVYLEGVTFTAIGEQVLVETLLHARGARTGIETAQRAFVLWTVRDDKVLRVETFVDREEALAAAESA